MPVVTENKKSAVLLIGAIHEDRKTKKRRRQVRNKNYGVRCCLLEKPRWHRCQPCSSRGEERNGASPAHMGEGRDTSSFLEKGSFVCGRTVQSGLLNKKIVTSGESKGYFELNLNCRVKFSPSYNVPSAPFICIVHLNKIFNIKHFLSCLKI